MRSSRPQNMRAQDDSINDSPSLPIPQSTFLPDSRYFQDRIFGELGSISTEQAHHSVGAATMLQIVNESAPGRCSYDGRVYECSKNGLTQDANSVSLYNTA